jgi:hypothetical protein
MEALLGFIGDNPLVMALSTAAFIMFLLSKKREPSIPPGGAKRIKERTPKGSHPADRPDDDVYVESSRSAAWVVVTDRIDQQKIKVALATLDTERIRKDRTDWKQLIGFEHMNPHVLTFWCYKLAEARSEPGSTEIRRLCTACAYIFDFELPPMLMLVDEATYSLIAWYSVATYPKHLHEYLAWDKDNTSSFPTHQDSEYYGALLADSDYICRIVAASDGPRLPSFAYVYKHAESLIPGDEKTKLFNLRLQLTYHAVLLGMAIPADWYAMNPYLYRKLLDMQFVNKD